VQMDEVTSLPRVESGPVAAHRVLLIDDQLMMAEALAARLESLPDIRVVGCRTWGEAGLLDAVRWLRPEVIMFEPAAYSGGAGGTVRSLLSAWPSARLIVLSASDSVPESVAAARAGADAWVSKHATVAKLEGVLRAVLEGGSYYPAGMLGQILRELRSDVRGGDLRADPLQALTPRERDVLARMVAGGQDRQIAMLLNISADTARTHARNIFAKLGVRNRLEAVAIAVQAGLQPAGVLAAPRGPADPGRPGTRPAAGARRR
jgi:two-component system, NarL family, response regulator LiaR